ncbi:MAG TPA: hypothetical protein VHQ90_10555 [Thermoanaerobaculia bacterium]|nr:hypothetical protein [Thermoanaerobaculia bacterium]
MRKTFICIVGLCLLFGTAALFAQGGTGSTGSSTGATTGTGSTTTTTTTTTHKGHKGGKAHKGAAYNGEVTAVDATAKTFTVKGKGKKAAEKTLSVDADTKYWLDGKAATWDDVKSGLWASGTSHKDGDKNVASTVKLKTPKAKAGKTTG